MRNPRVQRARRLSRRAHRRAEGAFLLEGNRALTDALAAGAVLEELFVADELAADPLVEVASGAGASVAVVGWPIIKAISDSVTPQGMVGVLSSPLVPLAGLPTSAGLLLVLDGVSDPGNAGTLIRTAAAAGADAVILAEGSADPLNPKTARSAAAAMFATNLVADVSLTEALSYARDSGYSIAGADSGGDQSLWDADLMGPLALVLGNESWGLSQAHTHLVDRVLSIPMPGPVDSLNVAMAGSVVMFEVLRQRRDTSSPTVSSATKEG